MTSSMKKNYFQALHSTKQKAATGGVLRKRCSEKFRKFRRKTSILESLFNKVAGFQTCNFVKMRYFPAKFAKVLGAPNLKNICE